MDDNKRSGGLAAGQRTSGPSKEVQRGTTDELQILGQIISQSPVLKATVLDRLRSARDRIEKRAAGAAPKLQEEKKKA